MTTPDESGLVYRRITGDYTVSVDDSADPDSNPDQLRPSGTVKCSPILPKAGAFRRTTATGSEMIIPKAIPGTIKNGVITNTQGTPGITLLAEVDGIPVHWSIDVEVKDGESWTIFKATYNIDDWGSGPTTHLPDFTPPDAATDVELAAIQSAQISAARAEAAAESLQGTLDTIQDGRLSKPELDASYGSLQMLNKADVLARQPVSHDVNQSVIVSFVDDDGHIKVMSILKDQIFDPEGVPATAAVCPGRTREGRATSVTEADIRTLIDAGWTVCSHTDFHVNLSEATPEAEAEADVVSARDYLDSLGADGDILVYPWNIHGEQGRRIARRHSIVALAGVDAGDQYNQMPIRQYAVTRTTMIGTAGVTVQGCKDVIDNAPAGSWIVFYSHVNEGSYLEAQTIADYREVIQYVKSKGYPILNVRDALERQGNIVDADDEVLSYKVGRNGEAVSGWKDGSITSASPLSAYPAGMSRLAINAADAAAKGFPVAGTLVTHRLASSRYSQDVYSYQEHWLYSHNSMFRRHWKGTEWSPWVRTVSAGATDRIPLHHTVWRPIMDMPTFYLEFEKVVLLSGEEATFTKSVFTTAEVSTNAASPTVVGEANGINLLCYYDATTKVMHLKWAAEGNAGYTYVRVNGA